MSASNKAEAEAMSELSAIDQIRALLEEARREADAIISAARDEAKALAAPARESAEKQRADIKSACDRSEETVEIRLFKDGGRYKDDVFVAVNGEGCLIKRGETVRVKRKFADVLEAGMVQDERTAEMQNRYSDEFAFETRARGL